MIFRHRFIINVDGRVDGYSQSVLHLPELRLLDWCLWPIVHPFTVRAVLYGVVPPTPGRLNMPY